MPFNIFRYIYLNFIVFNSHWISGFTGSLNCHRIITVLVSISTLCRWVPRRTHRCRGERWTGAALTTNTKKKKKRWKKNTKKGKKKNTPGPLSHRYFKESFWETNALSRTLFQEHSFKERSVKERTFENALSRTLFQERNFENALSRTLFKRTLFQERSFKNALSKNALTKNALSRTLFQKTLFRGRSFENAL